MIILSSRQTRAFSSFAVVFFLSIYVWSITALPIWVDESWTLKISGMNFLEIISFCLQEADVVHLTYYLICHTLTSVIHSSLILLRFLSLVSTIFTCVLLFKLAKNYFGLTAARITTLIYALFPSTFDYATQARSTALVSLLMTIILVKVLEVHRWGEIKPITLSLLSIATLSLNVLTIVLLGPLILYLLISKYGTLLSKFSRLVVSFPLFFVSPLIIWAHGQRAQVTWIAESYSIGDGFKRIFLWPLIESERNLNGLKLAIFIALILILILNAKPKLKVNGIKENFLPLIALYSFAPSTILWVISFFSPIQQTRYIAYSGVGIALLFGTHLSKCKINFLRGFTSISLVIVCLIHYSHIISTHGESFDWSNRKVHIFAENGESLLVASPSWYAPMFEYYIQKRLRVFQLQDIKKISLSEVLSCDSNSHNILIISPNRDMKVESSDIHFLTSIGYSVDQQYRSESNSVIRMRPNACL